MKQAKLESLFDYLPKSIIKAGDGIKVGKYPFYTSSENQNRYLNDFQHGPGCLVFGTGGKASVHLTKNRFSTSTDCITIKPKLAIGIDAGYVFHYFKGNIRVLERGFKGAGLKHISKAYLSDIEIPYPEDVDDQRRIASLLDKVEGLITNRKKHLRQLDDLLKSVFLAMFGDPVRNERAWHTAPLEQLGSINRGVSKHRPRNDPKLLGGPHPLIQTGEVSNAGTYITKYTQTYSNLGFSQSKLWPVGTLCITIAANIAQTGILTFDACFPDSVVGLLAYRGEANPLYIHGLFWFFQAILEKNAPAAAQKNINLEILRGLVVPKPPIGLQDEFAEVVEKVEALKSRYQQSLTDFEALYGALSQKAFKGELDLSRVPMPGIQAEEERTLTAESLPVTEPGLAIDLPNVENLLAALESPAAREGLITQWLEAYRRQLGGTSFSVQHFMAAAQSRWAELHPDNDFALSADDYELVKSWVFDALAAGTLTQAFDDAGNRVELKTAGEIRLA